MRWISGIATFGLLVSLPAQITVERSAATDIVLETRLFPSLENLTTIVKSGTKLADHHTNNHGQDVHVGHVATASRVRYVVALRSDTFEKHGRLFGTIHVRIRSKQLLTGVLTIRHDAERTSRNHPIAMTHYLKLSNQPETQLISGRPIQIRTRLDANGLSFSHRFTQGHLATLIAGDQVNRFTFEFREDERITSYGNGCGSTLAVTSDPQNRITFAGRGLLPGSKTAGLIFGAKAVKIPIPGTSCAFLTRPLQSLLWSVSSSGTASMRLSRLGGTYDYYSQVVEVTSSGALRTSNGVRVHVF